MGLRFADRPLAGAKPAVVLYPTLQSLHILQNMQTMQPMQHAFK